MKKRLLFKFLMLVSISGFSQWSADPNINTTVAASSNVSHRFTMPETIGDGNDGVITVYNQESVNDGTTLRELKVQRLSVAGVLLWGAGVSINNSTANILDKAIISDGAGGAVVLWLEEQVVGSYASKIFAQRIDNLGNKLWGTAGIEINSNIREYELSEIIIDATSNFVFSYTDLDAGKILAQKLNGTGAVQWGAGIEITEIRADGDPYQARIYPEGSGFIFLWEEEYEANNEEAYRYYWQRLNANGTKNGANILLFDFPPTAGFTYYIQQVVTDGTGGYYVSIVGDNDTQAKLYIQRVLADGTKVYINSPIGLLVDDSIGQLVVEPGFSYVNYGVGLESDGAGGAVLTWTDTRADNYGLYAQRFNALGTELWTLSGMMVVPGFASSDFDSKDIKRNNDGDFIFLIKKNGPSVTNHYYVQKISASGVRQYASSGVLVSSRNSYKYGDMVVAGNKVVVVWENYDGNLGTYGIYAQSVFSSGVLPVKFASFTAVHQQGKTKLQWSTAMESNNDYFTIERSEDGINFTSIGRQNAVGNSKELRNYDYTDANVFTSVEHLYYRIKQVDLDGTSTYTEIKSIKLATFNASLAKSYPNPAINKLNISVVKHGKSASYAINDIAGKIMLKGDFVGFKEVDVAHLPKGLYILKVSYDGEIHQEKIIKN